MPKPLVIVESPAKAKTIASILGRDFVVESSVGHIRDLPRRAGDVPTAYRDSRWARIGVDVDNDFKPLYIVTPDKKKTVQKLKEALKDASELYLATDEDREGESIAWHLAEVLNPRVPIKRMVFHEITRPAILHAVENPREIDRRRVDAQEARRILDRLFGYEVSPVLWKKVLPGLSAGRVQSVATRMLVERERARMRFRAASYWDIAGTFATDDGAFGATLVALDGRRLATGRDFDDVGRLSNEAVTLLDEAGARALAETLRGAPFAVRSVEEKPWRKSPSPPFMTSTLQQESSRKLRFSVSRTMQIAQRLYENGYITYHRTDSVTLSETAIAAAREQAAQRYGAEFVPKDPRRHQSKSKNAQEAHEAIRPAGESFRTPDEVAGELSTEELRLYDLIWKRTLASQMADAVGKSTQVRLGTRAGDRDAEFAASGRVISFRGFLKAMEEMPRALTTDRDDSEADLDDTPDLPPLAEGQALRVDELEPRGHETQPPPRFTEASLVKALEDMGVGRPSTYASIIGTIEDRGYVWKRGTQLIPSWTAFAVTELLERHFAHLVEYEFTAKMEDSLDDIAGGREESIPYLSRFYFGNGQLGLKRMVEERLGEIDAREINSIPIGRDGDEREIVVRVGRYGPYLERGEERASIPEDLPPDELTVERALELLAQPAQERELGADPTTGKMVYARAGRYGPYVQLGEPDPDRKEKPKTASLLSTMSLETVTLEDALRVLSLPRVVGVDDDGEEVVATTGRFGPFIRKGKETRSLETDEQVFTLTLEEARALLAQPKRGRAQRAAAQPLREIGVDPASGKPITLRQGRFGPYVTDGETNASLRKGDEMDSITLERAAELLQERRERDATEGKRPRKRAPARKRPARS